MKNKNSLSRRTILKSSLLGVVAISIPNIIYSKEGILNSSRRLINSDEIFHRYPSIDDTLVLEMVTVSHFNFNRVKELVNKRPEMARATWDWAFGDWETALGAASHVGRRDIAEFLMSKGARPDIFTYTMLGNYNAVTAMIEKTPGIESIAGPHGINLLQHAKAGLESESINEKQKKESSKLISYLEKLGTANPKATDINISPEDQKKYIGDYIFGDTPNAGISIKQTKQNYLTLGKLGAFGGALYQKATNVFNYSGTTTAEISFEEDGGQIISMTIIEPELTIKAVKI